MVSQVEHRLLSGPQSEWKNSVSFTHYSATWSFFLGLPLFFFSLVYWAGGLVWTKEAWFELSRFFIWMVRRANSVMAYSLSSGYHSMMLLSLSLRAYFLMLSHPLISPHSSTCSIVNIWLCLWHMWPSPKCVDVLLEVVANIIYAMTRGTYSFSFGFFHFISPLRSWFYPLLSEGYCSNYYLIPSPK